MIPGLWVEARGLSAAPSQGSQKSLVPQRTPPHLIHPHPTPGSASSNGISDSGEEFSLSPRKSKWDPSQWKCWLGKGYNKMGIILKLVWYKEQAENYLSPASAKLCDLEQVKCPLCASVSPSVSMGGGLDHHMVLAGTVVCA